MNTNSNDIFIISEDYNITESKVIQYNQVINNLNIDDIGDYIRKQEYLWNVHGEHEPQENIPIPLQLAYLHFFDKNSREIAKQSESNWNIGVMNTYFKTHVAHLCAAHNRCQTLNILSFEDNDNDVTYSTRLNRILSQIEDTWQFCFRYARIYDRVNNPPTTEDLSVSTDPSIFRFSMPDLSERSPFQTVLITFLKEGVKSPFFDQTAILFPVIGLVNPFVNMKRQIREIVISDIVKDKTKKKIVSRSDLRGR